MLIYDVKAKLLNRFSTLYGINPPVQVADVDFVDAGVWLQNGCNAKVTIRGKTASNNFKGANTIYYNRYRIDEELIDIRLPGKPGDYRSTVEVLAKLRAVYGLPLYDSDFFITAVDPTSGTVAITPRLDAVAWQPPYPAIIRYE